MRILQSNFNSDTRSFSTDKVIQEALCTSRVGELKDFGETLELYMPFIKLKKNEAVALGPQALESIEATVWRD